MRFPIFSNRMSRFALGAAALAGSALMSGCLWLDGHQSTFDTSGPVARSQLDLFYTTCWVSLVLFILVGSALAYAMIKFRAKTDSDLHAIPPEQSHGNPLIEMSLIAGSVLSLVIIAIPTLKGIWYTYDVPEADKANAYEITATGYQWWFKFDYPNETAQVPDQNGKLVNAPLTTGSELVIPAGRPVHVNLRTVDVIHSFWVPRLGGKVDMVPNRANVLWIEADKPGYFWGQCAEYCGESHAVMRFRVIALGPKEFNDWLNAQMAPARVVNPTAASNEPKPQFAAYRTFRRNEPGYTDRFETNPLDAWREQQKPNAVEDPIQIAKGRELFKAKTCIACHTIRGVEGAVGVQGPELTHVAGRTTIAGGLLENNRDELHRWIHAPNEVKPGNKMWANGYVPNHITLTPDDEDALVSFLESLK